MSPSRFAGGWDYTFGFSSSTGWTTTQSADWNVDTAGAEVDFSVDGTGTDVLYYDLGVISNTAWIYRIHDINFSTWNTYGRYQSQISSTTGKINTTQDLLGARQFSGGDTNDYWSAMYYNGATSATAQTSTYSGTFATATNYAHEIIRTSSTTLTAGISLNNFTSIANTSSQTVPSTVDTLRYFKFSEPNVSVPTGKNVIGTCQDLQFSDGVTTAP